MMSGDQDYAHRGSRLRPGSVTYRGRTSAIGFRGALPERKSATICFHKTEIGFSHLRECKVCQDYSDSCVIGDRYLVTACDGHGGKLYVRSDRGSRFASEAAIRALSAFDPGAPVTEERLNRLRLEILCEWNALVDRDLADSPLTMDEIGFLSVENRLRLQTDPTVAYGTTMHAIMLVEDRVIYASIGDGGAFLLRGEELRPLFATDDGSVANVTESLCQEDAYLHLSVGTLEVKGALGLLVCTDGTINPYRDLDNFRRAFVTPVFEKLAQGKSSEVERFMTSLGRAVGIGDDVSVGVILRERSVGRSKGKRGVR